MLWGLLVYRVGRLNLPCRHTVWRHLNRKIPKAHSAIKLSSPKGVKEMPVFIVTLFVGIVFRIGF